MSTVTASSTAPGPALAPPQLSKVPAGEGCDGPHTGVKKAPRDADLRHRSRRRPGITYVS